MKRSCPHRRTEPLARHIRRAPNHRYSVESLEPRLLLYHGPTILPDGSIEVDMDDSLDQFGFQVAMFQSYENLVSFSIFDTGASVVTVSAADQLLFDLFGSGGVPIKVSCGATADGVGGSLIGHVSDPGTVMADGLHVASLTFDQFGFPVFDIQFDPQTAAIVPGIQTFVGALTTANDPAGCPAPASESLPTITGTPILEPTTNHPAGSAALIRPQGELLDFSDFPELQGLVLPVPDLAFQDPGLGIPDDPACTRTDVGPPRDVCTDPVRIALDRVGFDNFSDPGDVPTESYNPVQNQVTVRHNGTALGDQKFLLDTGAQLSILSTAEAEALGLDLDHPQTSVAIQGAGGAVYDVPGFTIDRLTVPLVGGTTLSFTHVPIYVLDVAPGVIDGILGMNLFNNAAAMVYDPFDPRGPSLEVNFFTEHFIDESQLGGDQFSLLEAAMPGFAATLTGSHLPGFIRQDTPGPQQTGGFDFTNGVLTVTGTDQNDTIQLVKSGKGFAVQANFGNFTIRKRKSLHSVVVRAGGGDDMIDLSVLSSKQTSLIDAGGGNDSVIAGAGIDAVLGGDGNDQLNGSGGDNVLVGGDGADQLTGGRDSDLLVGGRLDESPGPIDFFALLATWRGARSTAAKRAAVQALVDRAIDDASPDILTSGKGVDLFVTSPLDQLADRQFEDVVM